MGLLRSYLFAPLAPALPLRERKFPSRNDIIFLAETQRKNMSRDLILEFRRPILDPLDEQQ
jgi:hypothetical protein